MIIQTVVWIAFLLASVYGHIALKRGVQATAERNIVAVLTSGWTWIAVLVWTLATLLWLLILRREPLLKANSISTLRYVLLCVASWAFLQEPLGSVRIIGIILIAAGVYLVAR